MAIGKQPDSGGHGGDDADEGESIFAEINITPLTDVFLVMVVIFMVSALAVQTERNEEKRLEQKQKQDKEDEAKLGLNLDLPSGQAAEIDTDRPSLIIDIPKDGDIYLGGKVIKEGDMDAMFRLAYVRDKNTQVILRADRGVPHGRVVNVMEHAKQAGLGRLAIGTGK